MSTPAARVPAALPVYVSPAGLGAELDVSALFSCLLRDLVDQSRHNPDLLTDIADAADPDAQIEELLDRCGGARQTVTSKAGLLLAEALHRYCAPPAAPITQIHVEAGAA
jgi:hypothetical protein